ncbi:MAG TPA: nucleotidyl transferase AbiEii/AbiGii toxin family protein [Chloroflexi bacterium]|nr:nucleotidyl transferase AbiEii/AbiGii toxin family protein [Chloroflexota bacterium]
MISPAKVARRAHHLGVGDHVIEKDHVLSWLLVAIAESELRSGLVFKGGTALKRCYYPEYRFSEDLDFTLCVDLSHDDLVEAFEALFPRLGQRVNLTLTLRSAEQSVFESTTLLVNYVGPLRARLGSRRLKVDVTRGELLLYPLNERLLQAPYNDYPTGVTLPTYALEEILTEKLCALMGRTEPRDLYGVYWLFDWGDVDLSFLPANFAAKCRHKGQNPDRLNEALTDKEETIERLWASRLAVQVSDLPYLNEVLRAVRRHLRGLGLI